MSVEVLDGATIRSFVEDEGAFNRPVDERFAALDANKDGTLSYAVMAKELRGLRVLDTQSRADEAAAGAPLLPSPHQLGRVYGGIFARFDRDGDEALDLVEFRAVMREVMMAVASGLGLTPVQMVVQEGCFLKRAVEREAAMLVAETKKNRRGSR